MNRNFSCAKRRGRACFAVVLLPFLVWVPGAAHVRTGQSDKPVELRSDLVNITATVFDARGRSIAHLKKEDFSVFEDEVRQEIAFISDERVPISVGIVFDTSGSMVDKLDGVQDAAKHFIATMQPADEAFLLRFSSDVEFVADFTNQQTRLVKAVDRLEAGGSTALYDALYEGLQKVRTGVNKKKAILLITDGNDTASELSASDVQKLATSSEVLVYCLGIGHGERGSFGHSSVLNADIVDMNTLESFSEVTGGFSSLVEGEHYAGGVDRIDLAVLDVANELRQQYTLAYYPSNTKRDGGYRTIKVKATNAAFTVRAKKGYFAPSDLSKHY